jgi:UDP-2,3-diacylglucosamine pyrophosphatase LpxH
VEEERQVGGADETIIVVSDFHLATGRDPRTGVVDREESFFHDEAFSRFLDDLIRQAATEQRRFRLLILGDLLDFLRVRAESADGAGGQPSAQDRTTLAKLEWIAAGHPHVFEALGRFVAAGFLLDVVPGNHDIELLRPAVQARFVEIVARSGGGSRAASAITVHPWIFYVPGLLYAEHGQQYHDVNAFPALLGPGSAQQSGQIEPPLGSHLETYLRGLGEAIDPAGGEKPLGGRSLLQAVRERPSLMLRTAPLHARFAAAVLGEMSKRSRFGRPTVRAAYRDEVLRPYAAVIGLDPDAVAAIDRLSAISFRQMTTRLAARAVTRSGVRGGRGTDRPLVGSATYLHRAALGIHRVLEVSRQEVPFYVFGHAHRAERVPLVPGAAVPVYLNSGSWTTFGPRGAAPDDGPPCFTYVKIAHQSGTAIPSAHVLLWNDATGRHEPLPSAGS